VLRPLLSIAFLFLSLVCGARATSQEQPPARSAETQPAFAPGHFHHLHLNSTDPASAIDFYTSKFDCEKGRFAGVRDAVWAQKSWLLFDKVGAPPPWELTSAIWHFGWGAEDMKAAYQKQLDSGTKFFTPLTDISDLARFPNFFFAYVEGPDRALIELNTAPHHRFGHLHLFSADPVSAGQWYVKHIGAARRGPLPSREPRFYRTLQVGPSISFNLDNVNVLIFPIEHSKQAYPTHWKKGQTAISPTKGRVVDHVAFSFDNLAEALERMRKDGVKVTQEIKTLAGTRTRHAFVEGPDNIRIELIEGHARNQ
jgi:catechol 2,3-dioxygenase-like lactoylglutathione lyase family enzyme